MNKAPINHKQMTARGFITAALRALKAEGIPVAKIPKVRASFSRVGPAEEGVHMSRVGLSAEVTLSWYHPDRHFCHGTTKHQQVVARCHEMEAKCQAILAKHGVQFDNKGWVTCGLA